MSKLLFAGSRTDCVSVVSGSLTESTSWIDTEYSDAGILVQYGTAKVQFYDPAAAPLLAPYSVEAGHSLFFHFFSGMDYAGVIYQGDYFIFYDNTNYPWLKFEYSGQWQYNSGTGAAPIWTNFGNNTYGLPGANRNPQPVDVRVTIDAGGNHTLTMLVNSAIAVAQVVFVQPLMTNLSYVTIQGSSYNGGDYTVASQILCTEDVSTVGAHVQTSRATGPGAHSAWLGAYTDVNEVVTNLSTYNQALTDSLQQSYPMSNITVPQGCNIAGVFAWVIVKNDGADPDNIAMSIQTEADVNHVTGDLAGVDIAFAGAGARYDVNPDTGVAWLQADWNFPVQLGYVSEA